MGIFFKKAVLFGIISALIIPGLMPQQYSALRDHGTGLIPLDSTQVDEIIRNWPRVSKANVNWLGFERINGVRVKKGKSRLGPEVIRPVGHELESLIGPTGAPQSFGSSAGLGADRPTFIDNSILKYFPPIRNQGSIGSCVAFSTTYTQLSYMTAFQRNLDIRSDVDNTNKYSPKWTYNMVNGGTDAGSTFSSNYDLLERHGACTWAQFPYDTDYRTWLLDPSAWMDALNVRSKPTQYVYSVSTDSGLELTKDLLANGYVLVFGTYMYSWQYKTVQDDPLTTDDDGQAGKSVCYWLNGTSGAHAMTIVGYNDAIWTDINSNGIIDGGERGAFRIANSWGNSWGDGGFVWLAYDALRSSSAVPGGPSSGRVAALQSDMIFILTARDNYSPLMVAEFTLNHAKRGQLGMEYGFSDTSQTTPTSTWTPAALHFQGGDYAFDGSTTPTNGTFFYDFTDTLNVSGVTRRYYLGISDNAASDIATLSAFRLIDLSTTPPTVVYSALVPQYVDNGKAYAYLDHTYTGPTNNHEPILSSGQVSPTSGTTSTTFGFWVWYDDQDGDVPTVMNVFIDGAPHAMALYSGYPPSDGWYFYQTALSVGSHNYWFSFADGHGGSAREPIVSEHVGPIVSVPHYISTPNIPTGEIHPSTGISYAYATGGSTCNLGHAVQYRFDWGDGSYSDWLAQGQTSTPHTWSIHGPHYVRAQARCAADTLTESSWSASLAVNVPATIPFSESFASSDFPLGWTQQNAGSGITDRWIVSNTNIAGGAPHEMVCQFQNVNPGTTRLVTPPINTSGYAALALHFKHMLDTWDIGGVLLKVQSSPDGTTWTDEGWTVTTSSSNIGPQEISASLAHNLNISTTYVGFVLTGNLYMFDAWLIDDVSITIPQAIPLSEAFSGSEFPAGWTQRNVGEGITNLWSVSSSNQAGGQPNEMLCNWQNINPGTARLVTPPVNTLGFSALRLRFKHYLDTFDSGGLQISVQTSADGLAWTDENWAVTTADVNIGPAEVDTTITHNLDIASTYIAFVITGNLYNFDFWCIDDVSLSRPACKADFNGDGLDDILWRYYGTGGMNRAWFLGETGQAGLSTLTGAIATPPRSLRGSPLSSRGTAAISSRLLQDMGLATDRPTAPPAMRNRETMVDLGRKAAGMAKVEDPRRAGKRHPQGAMNGVSDPRLLKTDRSSDPAEAAAMERFSAPNYLGGGDVMSVGDLNWQISGTGDFNNDGNVDILWRYNGSGGFNVVWLMNGTDWNSSAELLPVADLNWRIVGTGDFNKDSHIDILWRNSLDGSNVIWYMSGTNWIGSAILLGVSDQAWQVAGTGDFNKDGNVDILWRYTGAGGYNVVWYLNNAALTGSAELISVGDPSWQIAGTGDYNNDGNVDILWRYNGSGGYNYIWYMNGMTWIGGGDLLPVADLTWKIVSR
jgi:hypothetical protein